MANEIILMGRFVTKDKIVAKHREMWHVIAEKTRENKKKFTKNDYIALSENHRELNLCMDACYACEYARQQLLDHDDMDGNNRCRYCPFQWPDEIDGISYCSTREPEGGLFDKWRDARTYEEAAEIAEKIAELPEN